MSTKSENMMTDMETEVNSNQGPMMQCLTDERIEDSYLNVMDQAL